MSQIKITCAFCNTTFKVTPRDEARQVDCQKCQMPITVPAGKAAAVPEPPRSVFVPASPAASEQAVGAKTAAVRMPLVKVAPETPSARYRRLRENIRIVIVMIAILWHVVAAVHGLMLARAADRGGQIAYHADWLVSSITWVFLSWGALSLVGWMECLEPREPSDSADRS